MKESTKTFQAILCLMHMMLHIMEEDLGDGVYRMNMKSLAKQMVIGIEQVFSKVFKTNTVLSMPDYFVFQANNVKDAIEISDAMLNLTNEQAEVYLQRFEDLKNEVKAKCLECGWKSISI